MATVRLDHNMLASYEAELRGQGVPVHQWLRPGLTSTEVDALVAPIAVELPAEAKLWWEWHDGPIEQMEWEALGPNLPFRDLTRTIERYRDMRQFVMTELDPDGPPRDDPDWWWHPTWLPFAGDGKFLLGLDCSGAVDAPVPLRSIVWSDQDDEWRKSWHHPLGRWSPGVLEALLNGGWTWDQATNRWKVDARLVPLQLNRI